MSKLSIVNVKIKLNFNFLKEDGKVDYVSKILY